MVEGKQRGFPYPWHLVNSPRMGLERPIQYMSETTRTKIRIIRHIDVDGNYTIENTYDLVLFDCSTGNITATLPAVATNNGKMFMLKKIDSTGNQVKIVTPGTEVIDGEDEVILSLQWQYVTIVSDGVDWFIVGGEHVKMTDILLKQNELQEQSINKLSKIETHLSFITGEELKEEDTNED